MNFLDRRISIVVRDIAESYGTSPKVAWRQLEIRKGSTDDVVQIFALLRGASAFGVEAERCGFSVEVLGLIFGIAVAFGGEAGCDPDKAKS